MGCGLERVHFVVACENDKRQETKHATAMGNNIKEAMVLNRVNRRSCDYIAKLMQRSLVQ
jgi:hypothetical protein